jgi:hypothetical protein
MSAPLPPPHSESIRFVAQASRPGSIEARHIHSCTCAEVDVDRRLAWNQERVWEWQGSLSLDCPAHGRLLERHLEQVNASMRFSQHLTQDALDPSLGSSSYPPPPTYMVFDRPVEARVLRVRRRSALQRVVHALQGLVRRWRGV